ncbi:hypothetical protein IFR05_000525 [Cadophora sp. M221]|nr:hypothetical protein IFR05_000525 [Cadophora sp. M221]
MLLLLLYAALLLFGIPSAATQYDSTIHVSVTTLITITSRQPTLIGCTYHGLPPSATYNSELYVVSTYPVSPAMSTLDPPPSSDSIPSAPSSPGPNSSQKSHYQPPIPMPAFSSTSTRVDGQGSSFTTITQVTTAEPPGSVAIFCC